MLKYVEEVGRQITQVGMVLVCGRRKGIIEAACREEKSVGGLTIGFMPGLSRADANSCVDIAVSLDLGCAMRNFLTIRPSDAVIMLPGNVVQQFSLFCAA